MSEQEIILNTISKIKATCGSNIKWQECAHCVALEMFEKSIELETQLAKADRLVNCLSVICEGFGKSDSKINLIISPETKESICEIKKSICEYRATEEIKKGE